jgi:hypothetical protein
VRDGVPADQRGRRIVVDSKGNEVPDEIVELNEENFQIEA